MIHELQDYYCQRDHFGCHIFKEYAVIPEDIIKEIATLHPDCRVLEYILPRAGYGDTLRDWCKLSFKDAKKKLLTEFGIFGKYAAQIIDDPEIGLNVIDYHYWNWKLNESEEHPEYKIQIVAHRIANKFGLLDARMSDPLKFGWIE